MGLNSWDYSHLSTDLIEKINVKIVVIYVGFFMKVSVCGFNWFDSYCNLEGNESNEAP